MPPGALEVHETEVALVGCDRERIGAMLHVERPEPLRIEDADRDHVTAGQQRQPGKREIHHAAAGQDTEVAAIYPAVDAGAIDAVRAVDIHREVAANRAPRVVPDPDGQARRGGKDRDVSMAMVEELDAADRDVTR